MKIGFGKRDITPRLGIELYGYSGYLNRYASAIRDRLWARSMAASDGSRTAVVVSCDLVFVTRELTAAVRRIVARETGLAEECVMVHATHTHSGPCIRTDYRNAYDPPYMELLPRRIAASCIEAVRSLQAAEILYAAAPCEGMGTNRVYDKFSYGQDALQEDFRPAHPELTDTSCRVLKIVAQGRMLGFVSYFGCHNVVGGQGSTYIHGDYAGIATGMLERENSGTVGLFLQGAEGDVNTSGCCFDNTQVIKALDIMAGRYARAVRAGLAAAGPIEASAVRFTSQRVRFSRRAIAVETLRKKLAVEMNVIEGAQPDDADEAFRWAVLRSQALRSIINRVERGISFENETEVQGIRIGPVALLAAPLEIFQAIKNEITAGAAAPIPLVLSLTNDEQGYATDRVSANNEADYAAQTVPLWKHSLPYAGIHDELVAALLAVDRALAEGGGSI